MSRQAQWRQEKICEFCGRSYLAARSDSRSCGPACKKALQRGSKEKRDWCRKKPGKPDAGTVPFIAAGDKQQRYIERAQLKEWWPQNLEVIHEPVLGDRKPGRIDWRIASAHIPDERRGLIPVNLGFAWKWVHPCRLFNMARRPS